jgi:hypothetical protein
MVAPLVDDFSALQAVMKPASNAAAKRILVRTLIPGFYPGTRDCKVKIQPSPVRCMTEHRQMPRIWQNTNGKLKKWCLLYPTNVT